MGEAEAEQFDENRFICFMCGGLSLAEMCSLKKEPSLRGIVLATDDVLTPKRYIDQLRSINLGQKSK